MGCLDYEVVILLQVDQVVDSVVLGIDPNLFEIVVAEVGFADLAELCTDPNLFEVEVELEQVDANY